MKKLLVTTWLGVCLVTMNLLSAREITVGPGQSIKTAVENAKAGDVVRLTPGTWNITNASQVVRVPNGVSVIGAGMGKTLITTVVGTQEGIRTINRGLAVFSLKGGGNGNQRVGRFTIDGKARKGYAGLVVQGRSNVEVFEVEVKYTRGFAMIFDGLRQTKVLNCRTKNSGSFASTWSWGAVMMWNLTDFRYEGNFHEEEKSYCVKSQSTSLTNVHFKNNTFHTLGTMSPWGSGGSENIAAEFHGVYHNRVIFEGNHFDNQLSIASNHRSVYEHRLHIFRNAWIAPKHRSHKPDYNIELNIYSTQKDVLVYENYGNCRSRFIGTWLQGKKAGGWKVYNNVADNMRGGGRYSGFIAGNSVLADIDIYRNTIYHPYKEEWSLIYLDNKAKEKSRNIRIFRNIIRVADHSQSWLIRHDNKNAFSNVSVTENLIEGFRKSNKYRANGINSSQNLYQSARFSGTGAKPFPFFESQVDYGAKSFPIEPPPPGSNGDENGDENEEEEEEEEEEEGGDDDPVIVGKELVIDCGTSSDHYFEGGNRYTGRSGKTERYGSKFFYRIPVKSNLVEVSMDLTEIFWKEAGRRVFNINLEGGEYEAYQLDPYKKSPNEPLIETYTVEVTDGILDIEFTGIKDNAKVNAIGISNLTVGPGNVVSKDTTIVIPAYWEVKVRVDSVYVPEKVLRLKLYKKMR